MGEKFYKFLKLFYGFVITFLAIVYVMSVVYNIIYLDFFLLVLIHIVFIFIVLIMTYIFSYYRNMTVDISFFGDDIFICTNKEKLKFPKKQVAKIIKMPGKIVLICYISGKKKCFLHQIIYFPFKKSKISFEYLKANLPNCKLSVGNDQLWTLYYWR